MRVVSDGRERRRERTFDGLLQLRPEPRAFSILQHLFHVLPRVLLVQHLEGQGGDASLIRGELDGWREVILVLRVSVGPGRADDHSRGSPRGRAGRARDARSRERRGADRDGEHASKRRVGARLGICEHERLRVLKDVSRQKSDAMTRSAAAQ